MVYVRNINEELHAPLFCIFVYQRDIMFRINYGAINLVCSYKQSHQNTERSFLQIIISPKHIALE